MRDRFIPIVRLEIRRLTLSQKGSVDQYLKRVDKLFNYYQIEYTYTELETIGVAILKIKEK